MDDIRIGQICRALRRRLGWRQVDLAAKVACHQTTISRLERGQLDSLSMGLIQRGFAALGARYEGAVSWRGADVDRLLDELHSALVEAGAATYIRYAWEVMPEVSFSVYGERGSIDLLAVHRPTRTVAVNEMKTAFGSVEETLRRHDAKARLAPGLVRERLGFVPARVVRVLVVLDDRTNRRVVERHRRTFDAAYSLDTRATARMLRNPGGEVANGIMFVTPKRPRLDSQRAGGRQRVRRPRAR